MIGPYATVRGRHRNFTSEMTPRLSKLTRSLFRRSR